MITYPLNNIDYTAEDAELYFCTRKSGVHDENDFDISVTGVDSSVTIGTGIAWIRNSKFSGKVVALKEPETLSLSLPDAVYDRIDSIVIQFDANQNKSEIIVKEGNPSSDPVAPSVAQDESVYELHLYHILRKAGSSVISLSNVTDHRKNQHYCGIMIDPVTAIDETLEKRGFAADAESVGYKLNEVKKGAAPAGYGLGEASVKMLTSSDDLNSIRESGWYRWGESVPSNAPTIMYDAMYSYMRVDAASSGTFTQIVRSGYGTAMGIEVKRSFTGGTTDGWEWVNPPMFENAEYRTTERWNGKVVYTKLVEFGSLPATDTKTVACGVSGSNICSVVGTAYSESNGEYTPLPIGSNGAFGAYFWVSSNENIGVRTMTDLSRYSAVFALKYTKD